MLRAPENFENQRGYSLNLQPSKSTESKTSSSTTKNLKADKVFKCDATYSKWIMIKQKECLFSKLKKNMKQGLKYCKVFTLLFWFDWDINTHVYINTQIHP